MGLALAVKAAALPLFDTLCKVIQETGLLLSTAISHWNPPPRFAVRIVRQESYCCPCRTISCLLTCLTSWRCAQVGCVPRHREIVWAGVAGLLGFGFGFVRNLQRLYAEQVEALYVGVLALSLGLPHLILVGVALPSWIQSTKDLSEPDVWDEALSQLAALTRREVVLCIV